MADETLDGMGHDPASSAEVLPEQDGPANLHRVGFTGDDAGLVRALQDGHPGAPAALFDRYSGHVQGVLSNVIGVDPELPDLLHEVFTQALKSIHSIKDPQLLKAWISRIAVFTARGCLRYRKRRRWLTFLAPEKIPDPPAPGVSDEAREAVRSVYELLDQLGSDERLVFALRFINGMELKEVAEACGVSLATIKRRLSKAEARFCELARDRPELHSWMAEGTRWAVR